MSDLHFSLLREVNLARCIGSYHHPLELWTPDDWFAATAGECGEACNAVKKLNRFRDGIVAGVVDRPQLLQDLAHEIADAMIYLDLLAARLDLDLFQGATVATLLSHVRRGAGFESVVNGSQACRVLMKAVGRLGLALEDAPPRHRVLTFGLEAVAIALGTLATMYEIDLARAIADKFNATSIRLGFPERLYA